MIDIVPIPPEPAIRCRCTLQKSGDDNQNSVVTHQREIGLEAPTTTFICQRNLWICTYHLYSVHNYMTVWSLVAWSTNSHRSVGYFRASITSCRVHVLAFLRGLLASAFDNSRRQLRDPFVTTSTSLQAFIRRKLPFSRRC